MLIRSSGHHPWSLIAEDLEELEEDVDDVEVEDHGGHDVVVDIDLVTLASHDQLGVEQEVEAEQDHTEKDIEYVQSLAPQEEEWEDEKDGEADDKEERSEHGEVVLCRECVYRDANYHSGSADCCRCYYSWLILSSDEADHS